MTALGFPITTRNQDEAITQEGQHRMKPIDHESQVQQREEARVEVLENVKQEVEAAVKLIYKYVTVGGLFKRP